jgi:Uma2 family endonuclease
VEVFSESTANYDRGEKFERYRSIPTLEEYLLIDSRRVKAEQGRWTLMLETNDLAQAVPIRCFQRELVVASFYDQTEDLVA